MLGIVPVAREFHRIVKLSPSRSYSGGELHTISSSPHLTQGAGLLDIEGPLKNQSLPITHWMLNKENAFLPMVDHGKNTPKERIVLLFILREHAYHPWDRELSEKLKIVLKRLRVSLMPIERHLVVKLQLKCQEFGAIEQGEILKNLRSFI